MDGGSSPEPTNARSRHYHRAYKGRRKKERERIKERKGITVPWDAHENCRHSQSKGQVPPPRLSRGLQNWCLTLKTGRRHPSSFPPSKVASVWVPRRKQEFPSFAPFFPAGAHHSSQPRPGQSPKSLVLPPGCEGGGFPTWNAVLPQSPPSPPFRPFPTRCHQRKKIRHCFPVLTLAPMYVTLRKGPKGAKDDTSILSARIPEKVRKEGSSRK